MHNEFTAVFERDEDWVIAYCPEIPGANGQAVEKPFEPENLQARIVIPKLRQLL